MTSSRAQSVANVILAALAVVTGFPATPAYSASEKLYASSMESRMQYRGFTVARPSPPGWYAIRSEQIHTDAMFRRDNPAGGTYSAFVSVSLRSLPRAATCEADFDQLARQDKISDTERFKVLSYYQKPIRVQGQWAIQYEVTVRDVGAPIAGGKLLLLHNTGRGVSHPTFPQGIILINNSERGMRNELNAKIQVEGRSIMDGVQLESAPGRPVS